MSKKKQSIKKITETFRWKPSPAIEWILKNDRTKFMENHQYAPLSILLEEHGFLAVDHAFASVGLFGFFAIQNESLVAEADGSG